MSSRGLVLLFGIGTKAVPPWDPRTRRNNLMDGLAVRRTALLGVPGRAIVHQRRELAGRMKLALLGLTTSDGKTRDRYDESLASDLHRRLVPRGRHLYSRVRASRNLSQQAGPLDLRFRGGSSPDVGLRIVAEGLSQHRDSKSWSRPARRQPRHSAHAAAEACRTATRSMGLRCPRSSPCPAAPPTCR